MQWKPSLLNALERKLLPGRCGRGGRGDALGAPRNDGTGGGDAECRVHAESEQTSLRTRGDDHAQSGQVPAWAHWAQSPLLRALSDAAVALACRTRTAPLRPSSQPRGGPHGLLSRFDRPWKAELRAREAKAPRLHRSSPTPPEGGASCTLVPLRAKTPIRVATPATRHDEAAPRPAPIKVPAFLAAAPGPNMLPSGWVRVCGASCAHLEMSRFASPSSAERIPSTGAPAARRGAAAARPSDATVRTQSSTPQGKK